ncbi:hypothetical protein PGT21_006175 [Puccinia graminis f. sp. tritici]|uniref:Uncharacterized protein n=1 Tax=Puccinia graminis f. sp. tritici TaxID=56615 RepID=A0A5B0NMW1_PUCGR|nr:hypothetical protein PGT21_006175 [Puccinia graminis f. sp. tritici]KAA1090133.1 hypothetical protein PGTUg99_036222 [Puccinia graminis f. sp. tritici]
MDKEIRLSGQGNTPAGKDILKEFERDWDILKDRLDDSGIEILAKFISEPRNFRILQHSFENIDKLIKTHPSKKSYIWEFMEKYEEFLDYNTLKLFNKFDNKNYHQEFMEVLDESGQKLFKNAHNKAMERIENLKEAHSMEEHHNIFQDLLSTFNEEEKKILFNYLEFIEEKEKELLAMEQDE